MTTSPVPSSFLFTPSAFPSSQSLYFLILQPRVRSMNGFTNLRLKISCSAQTIETGTQGNRTVKKKRKPRPSFLEKIEEKWSFRTTSSREKMPWQEEEIENFAKVGERCVQPSGVGVSESLSEKTKVVSEEVSLSPTKREYLPPWVHGNKKTTSQLDSERKNLEKSTENSGNLNGFCEHSENHAPSNLFPGLTKLEEKISFDEGNGEKDAKIDDTQIGLSHKAPTLTVKPDDDKACDGSVGSFQTFSKLKGPNDARRSPWERESEIESVEGKRLRKSNTKLAEKVIPEPELKRLRNVALRMVERIKVGAAGVTRALVDSIHEKWKEDEVVKLKFEGPPAMQMRRTHEILESRTRGLVIWRSGSSVVLYRGIAYKLDCVQSFDKQAKENAKPSESSSALVSEDMQKIGVKHLNGAAASSRIDSLKQFNSLSGEQLKDLQELNLLLDELGPRFTDWSGREPLPVDADLLPAVVPGYRRPFRLLPHGLRPCLRDKEMTYFRRTARTMPPHFALGRNRELQGLAMAMVKLWEKCAIAKIAIKRGVQNTSNERMAEELKVLTGGTLLSRNKEYIVFYRGNDFLPPGVTEALGEKENLSALQQDEEEKARQKAVALIDSNDKVTQQPLIAGTLSETKAATLRWTHQPSSEDLEKMMKELAVTRHASLVKFLEKKLAIAKGKITKAEKALQKVQESLEPAELPIDLETLSDEERFLFRKIGLSMKTYLLLGRRGIFDGTIENMHLHWKYRELVKIIVEGKNFPQVKHIAISLEAESGGVLVSVDKTNKGYAIIIYRGKNYQRPTAFRPKNLLTRRQALARAIELQRREALKHHVSELQGKIEKLKSELEDMKVVKEIDEETLHSRIDDASDDDDDDLDEDESEEAYLKIYDYDGEDGIS